jgi:predicted RNase H-like HicB family nuclease
MVETITLDVELRAFVRRESSRRWIAVCPSVGVASQASSAEDAKRCIQEAVELWFESCIERGVLDRANFRPLNEQGEPGGTDIVSGRRSKRRDVLGDDFALRVTIPAYQGAAVLTACV